MDIIQRLIDDHKSIVKKINQLPAALLKAKQNLDLLNALSAEIESDLSVHEKIEDRLLFPALRGKIGDPVLQSLVKEHEESKNARELFLSAILELKKNGGASGSPEKIKEMSNHGYKLMRILSTHLTREDQLLFPHCKSVLSKEELEKLGEEARSL
jgi:hemerythrin-like domain-containing protein